jgi:micrococcal nuclease
MTFRISIPRAAAILAFGLWASPAMADPCEGALPAKGTSFSGVVRYVGDGDGLCVGPAGRPDRWIEIRLGDFYAPELHERGGVDAKQRLERLVIGQTLVCRAGRRSYDRVIGFCTLRGRPLGSLLRQAGGREGGRGWKR